MKVMVIGLGYWGSKILDRLAAVMLQEDIYIADTSEQARLVAIHRHQMQGSETRVFEDYNAALQGYHEIDACIVATPIPTHYQIARACLEAGKHVLVEKPMAKTAAEAGELLALANRRNLTLLTDLTFLYDKRIGQLAGETFTRMKWWGPQSPRSQDSILWTWGPHPVSLMLWSRKRMPVSVRGYLQSDFADLVYEFDTTGHVVRIMMGWGTISSQRAVYYLQPGLYDRKIDLVAVPDPEPLMGALLTFMARAQHGDVAPDFIGKETVEVLEWTERKLSESH